VIDHVQYAGCAKGHVLRSHLPQVIAHCPAERHHPGIDFDAYVDRHEDYASKRADRHRAIGQGQKLLRLAERYTAERLDAACARALGFDLVDVRRVERILVLALEHEGQPSPPADQRVQELPAGRFTRPGSAFDHRFTVTLETAP
jgi:hypothetical protein